MLEYRYSYAYFVKWYTASSLPQPSLSQQTDTSVQVLGRLHESVLYNTCTVMRKVLYLGLLLGKLWFVELLVPPPNTVCPSRAASVRLEMCKFRAQKTWPSGAVIRYFTCRWWHTHSLKPPVITRGTARSIKCFVGYG